MSMYKWILLLKADCRTEPQPQHVGCRGCTTLYIDAFKTQIANVFAVSLYLKHWKYSGTFGVDALSEQTFKSLGGCEAMMPTRVVGEFLSNANENANVYSE